MRCICSCHHQLRLKGSFACSCCGGGSACGLVHCPARGCGQDGCISTSEFDGTDCTPRQPCPDLLPPPPPPPPPHISLPPVASSEPEPEPEPVDCADDASFDGGHGGCATYAAGGANVAYCEEDGADVRCQVSCGTCTVAGPPELEPVTGGGGGRTPPPPSPSPPPPPPPSSGPATTPGNVDETHNMPDSNAMAHGDPLANGEMPGIASTMSGAGQVKPRSHSPIA